MRPACLVCAWRTSCKASKGKTICVQRNVLKKRSSCSLNYLCRQILLSFGSPFPAITFTSASICTVENMYEYGCKYPYLSLSTDFQKMFLLNASIAPLCKGTTLFSSEHSAVLFEFIYFIQKHTLYFSDLFFQHSK